MRYDLTADDRDLILAFAGCTLDEKPGSNWVQDAGGLPQYICEIARAIKRGGKSTSQAIAIAVSRVKVWATGKGVDAKTQAKAVAAVAEWEKKRVSSKAKKAAKGIASAAKNDKMSASFADGAVLNLSDYNMDTIRQAFDQRTRKIREDWRAANPSGDMYGDDAPQRLWVKEVWNAFVIVQSSYGDDPDLYKIPYTVGGDGDVTFGDAVEVQQQYVEVTDDGDDDTLTDDALKQMMATVGPCHPTAVDRVLAFSSPSALERILAATAQEIRNTSALAKFVRETD